MAIKIKLEGFDELLEQIEKAEGEADRAANSALSASAVIMESELRAQLNAATESNLAQRMPKFKIKHNGNSYRAEVGFQSTPYNPRDPSDYHKASLVLGHAKAEPGTPISLIDSMTLPWGEE